VVDYLSDPGDPNSRSRGSYTIDGNKERLQFDRFEFIRDARLSATLYSSEAIRMPDGIVYKRK
jgi:hypothetical protein